MPTIANANRYKLVVTLVYHRHRRNPNKFGADWTNWWMMIRPFPTEDMALNAAVALLDRVKRNLVKRVEIDVLPIHR